MRSSLILLAAFILMSCGQKQVSYREKIQPILAERCVSCHGPDLARAKVSVASYQELMKSKTKSGRQPLVTPGNLEESWLYTLCSTVQPQYRMPPDTSHKVPLPKEELALLQSWIMQGARDN